MKTLIPEFEFFAKIFELDTESNPVLYHYCSVESFINIASSRCIRLSDINRMNDFSEFRWAYKEFMQVVGESSEKYEREFFEYLDKKISQLQLHTLPFVACFSKDGDVLSQWRAYADDGAGVAIGFDAEMIRNLAIRCANVNYEKDVNRKYFESLLSVCYPMWKILQTQSGKQEQSNRKALNDFVFNQTFDMCLIKNPGFREEQEVRILRAVTVEVKDGNATLSDPGGSGSDKTSRAKQVIKLRSRNGEIIPHIDLPFWGRGKKIIKELVIGPRCPNSDVDVSLVLGANGFEGAQIRHSEVTYR